MILLTLFIFSAGCSGGGNFAGLDVTAFGNQKELIGYYLTHREELGLGPDQIEKLKTIRENYRKAAAPEEADLKVAYADLSDILDEDTMNLDKADRAINEIGQGAAAVGRKYVRAVAEAKKVLTADQLRKARLLLEK
jgi:division protein CdvB (Snf7/Vps24/ESCRT-III family)